MMKYETSYHGCCPTVKVTESQFEMYVVGWIDKAVITATTRLLVADPSGAKDLDVVVVLFICRINVIPPWCLTEA